MNFQLQFSWVILFLLILFKFTQSCTMNATNIGVCLHTYLERDFPSIEMVVYPKYHPSKYPSNGSWMLEGPKLEADCRHLREVLECFVGVLKDCKYMEDFFEYRLLIDSLEKTHDWICGDITSMRERFVVVLTKLQCMEDAWTLECNNSPTRRMSPNVWNKILRREEDSSICSSLIHQRECLVNSRRIARCGEHAKIVYANMSHVFLSNWCPSGCNENIAPYLTLIIVCLWHISMNRNDV